MDFVKAGNRFGQYVSCDNEFAIIEEGDTVVVGEYCGIVEKILYSSLSYLVLQCNNFTLHLELDVKSSFGLFVLATTNASNDKILAKFYADVIYVPGQSVNKNITHGISHMF